MHRLACGFALMFSMLLPLGPAQNKQSPPLQDVPSSEVKKIEGNCQIRVFSIMDCNIYNGSDDWTMEVETALITVHDRKGTDVLSRRYNIKAHLPPLTNSPSTTDLGVKFEEGQTWSVSFVAAKGYR
jgi:hypothetical protein